MNPPPSYLVERLAMFERLKKESDDKIASYQSQIVTVTLPDGKMMEAETWKTTPYDIAAQISKGLADNAVIAKVNGELWDLDRPLEEDAQLQILKFDDNEGKMVFWHSSAHILGEAMEKHYGGCLCYGPPIACLLYTSPSPRDRQKSRMPSSA